MKKADLIGMAIPIVVVLIVFLPICTLHYFYTDELVHLWLYKKGTGFDMFRPQGRLLTDWLFGALFGSIHWISELSVIRMISMGGWLLVIPVWYTVLNRIARAEELPGLLPFFTTLYLVTSLPVSVSIQWASTMELFIAYTAGLLSGYLIWLQRDRRNWVLMALALVPAMISLFTYQNGFGCFLLPFFLRFIAMRRPDRQLTGALIFYTGAYIVYFAVFKSYMAISGGGVSERAALVSDPVNKIGYFFMKALPAAFYFNIVVQENSRVGRVVYFLILAGCTFLYCRKAPNRLQYVAGVFGAWILIYLPSLIVKENYASNRTLLALDLSVFIWVMLGVLDWVDDRRSRMLAPAMGAIALIAIARYNLHTIFLPPAVEECRRLSDYIENNYHPGVDTVYFVRTGESFVRDKYKTASSWDEFGFSSSYFAWVPEYLVRQLIYEKTGDRKLAEAIHVIDCSGSGIGIGSRPLLPGAAPAGAGNGAHTLIVDAPAILGDP